MKRINAIELRQAIANKELRAKHLSGSNLVTLAFLKKELNSYFETMADAETQATEAEGIKKDSYGNFIVGTNTEFEKKLKEIQATDFESNHLNFIENDVVSKFVADTDVSTAIVVIEHLAKKDQ